MLLCFNRHELKTELALGVADWILLLCWLPRSGVAKPNGLLLDENGWNSTAGYNGFMAIDGGSIIEEYFPENYVKSLSGINTVNFPQGMRLYAPCPDLTRLGTYNSTIPCATCPDAGRICNRFCNF